MFDSQPTSDDPHATQPVLMTGAPPDKAAAALILLHGRGGTAENMLGMYSEVELPGLLALAPQAAGQTWYPQSFLAPIEANQPCLDSALKRVATLVNDLMHRGIASERIALLGFSQGACLSSEFAARHPRRYGAIMALTGGLIGPPGTPRNYSGSLAGTPVFLGTSDPDPHVPLARVQETEAVLSRMGATVGLRRYPGMPHTVNREELEVCRGLLEAILANKESR